MTGYLRDLISYRQMEVFDETATIDKLKRIYVTWPRILM